MLPKNESNDSEGSTPAGSEESEAKKDSSSEKLPQSSIRAGTPAVIHLF